MKRCSVCGEKIIEDEDDTNVCDDCFIAAIEQQNEESDE